MKLFFKKIDRDPILRKIVFFYYNNPGSVDTADNIAQWVEEEEEIVVKKLEYLAKINILNKDKSYATIAYSYTQNKETISIVKNFLEEQGYD